MIYWFTGQPGAGKTVLADLLVLELMREDDYLDPDRDIFRIDGDDLRDLFTHKDYSIKGRVQNVSVAQKIATYLDKLGKIVIVSLVSPYIDQRDEFKAQMQDRLVEFYVHTEEERPRKEYKLESYQPPRSNFIDVDTTGETPGESISYIVKNLKERGIF